MQAVFKKEDMTKALGVTLGVVEKKQTIPILANVLLEINDAGFHLTTTDLESEVKTSGSLESVSSGGRTTISAKKLNDLCRLMPDASSIEIKLSGDKIQLRTPLGKYSLATLPSDDFPIFDIQESGEQLKINSKDLRKIFSRISFAIGIGTFDKQYMSGLSLELKDDFLTAAASDGVKLAIYSSKVSAENSLSEEIPNFYGVIPKKSVNEMTKFLADADEEASLLINDHAVVFNIGNITFKSKLIAQEFPDPKRLLQTTFQKKGFVAEVGVKELSQSLSRVSVLSTDTHNTVYLNLSGGSLTVSANNSAEEAGEETLNVKYSGEDINIAFNVNYLQEILSHLDGNVCNIEFFEPSKPIVIQPPDVEFPKYVLLPLFV